MNVIKKSAIALAVVAAGVAGTTELAVAGEITGNGERSLAVDTVTVTNPETGLPVVLNILNGNSECAFSGQNDGYFDGSEPGVRVQSFGQVVKVAGPLGGVPGGACNPHRNGATPRR